ncbi:MAG: metal ABC transporter ATP-binding protein [Anaerolineae bacterium]|nr:metal ABC transporter ATP-binding protein [Anaerolineae bacterium]
MTSKRKRYSRSAKSARHEADAPILDVAGLGVEYDGQIALDHVSFRLVRGEQIAVVGPNGAGKSTLFKAIAGVLQPTRGRIQVAGHQPGRHICIAYVPQHSRTDQTFPVNVADVVMMGRIGKLGWLRHPRSRDWEYVDHCIETVGLTDLVRRQIGELSGGQQQRMFIARALAQEAELMLMDEPLTGLDVTAQEKVIEVLEALRPHGVTVLVATHDLNLAARQFDRVMLLNKEMIGFGKPDEALTTERLRLAYGEHLQLIHIDERTIVVSDTCCEGGVK